MSPAVRAALWRRLDVPGHDACRLAETHGGWALEGTAVFLADGVPAALSDRVECDDAWRSITARVLGFIGGEDVAVVVDRDVRGDWCVNGVPHPALGDSGDAPAAWLDAADGSLTLLHQRYGRRSADVYLYEAPTTGYSDVLVVGTDGFVREYPGLWSRDETVADSS